MSTSTQTQEGVGSWTIDPVHSQVEFGVRHMMLSTVKGYFTGIQGTIHLDTSDFSDSSVQVQIDASTIDTRQEDRDAHLRSGDFLNVEEHPVLEFQSKSVEGTPEDFRITGDLRIRGTTRQVTLKGEKLGRGTDPWGNPRVGFRGETKINREDFGLTWNQALETGGVLVGKEVRISLEIQAIPADADQDG